MSEAPEVGTIDYWCNAFLPDRRKLWDEAIAAQGIPLKVRRDPADSLAEPREMLARMDELGIDTLLLPTAQPPSDSDPLAYERFATSPSEATALVRDQPGRFASLWSLDPGAGQAGVTQAAEALARPGCVGLHLHTHSFDRAFDHRDLYPFYALAADTRVPVVMQAGASGGRMPSECGRPLGVDRPALYFPGLKFVLSHTGWPWVDEAFAMAQKHPNVSLGTAAYPPRHWSPELRAFIAGVGRGKTLFGTSFPVVGHRHALGQLAELNLEADARESLLEGTARTLFTRLEAREGGRG